MLLKEALKIHKNSWNKLDILEILWAKLENDYLSEKHYKEKIEKLPKWDFFISDLDWTFFRWTLIQEAFSLFIKYIKNLDIRKVDTEFYKSFLDDYIYFINIETDAYNKQISYYDYLTAGLFMIFKYKKLIDFDNYLEVLKAYFYKKDKVNPFRFSMKLLEDTIKSWINFLFVSWASNFIFDIYLKLLKKDITKRLWKKYADRIYWISTYVDFDNKKVYDLWSSTWKNKLINDLKKNWTIKKIIGWMWDTTADFWISNNLEIDSDFYFINPAKSVVTDFDKLKKSWINYHLITEKKDLIFEFNIDKIKIL